MVLNKLVDINEVAYIRFASVYRKFQGIRDFVDTLDHLQNHKINHIDSAIAQESSEVLEQAHYPDWETPASCLTSS